MAEQRAVNSKVRGSSPRGRAIGVVHTTLRVGDKNGH